MPVKRVKISEEDDNIIEAIKKKENISNEELWSKMIRLYYLSDGIEMMKMLKIIKEYVTLLVKSNDKLPTKNQPQEMYEMVHSISRYHALIEDKVTDEKKL